MKCQVQENPMKTYSLNAQPHNLKSKALSFVKIRNKKKTSYFIVTIMAFCQKIFCFN